jgi:fatty acid amide hydrolase 2
MQEAGAIHLAVTNVPGKFYFSDFLSTIFEEAGLWWETSNGIFGCTNNPYDSRLSAGGSTGGEGSLISAAGSVVGVGSDFGGSIRIPSMLNCLFGLKPTPKLVPFNVSFLSNHF